MIYLDCAASAPLYDEVLRELERSQREDFANPSSSHRLGRKLKEKIEGVGRFLLKTLGGKNDDVLLFTSGATESNNILIKGLDLGEGDEVLFTLADHPSLSIPVKGWKEKGAVLKNYSLGRTGEIDWEELFEKINAKTRLLLLSSINSQSGCRNYFDQFLSQVKSSWPQVIVHVDASQAFGKIPINVCNVDSLTFSGHKLGAPKGIGGLYLKKGLSPRPLFEGGGHQGGLRPSTLAAPLITAFGKAVEIGIKNQDIFLRKAQEHHRYLREKLLQQTPELIFPFEEEKTSPYILMFIYPGIPSDILLRHLEMEEIFLSSTSACSSKKSDHSEVFDALGIERRFHKNVLRLSFYQNLTHDMIHRFVEVFGRITRELDIYRIT